MRCRLFVLLLLLAPVAQAQQYESEARVVSNSEANQATNYKPEEALKEAQGNPYAQAMILRDLAGQAMRDGNEAAAAKFLKRALDTKALSGFAAREMQKELAVLLAATEDYAAVVRELAPILRDDKEPSPALQLVLGGAYAQLGRFREALPLIEAALKETKAPPHDWYALAAAAAAGLKRYSDAVQYIERALRAAPGELAYWQQLSSYQVARKDAPGALAAMDMAFRLGLLESANDRMRFAQLFFANGVPFEAASLLQDGIDSKLLSRDKETLEMLAAAWVAAREYEFAVPALQDALRAGAGVQLMLQLGQIQFDRGDWDGASRALRQALSRGAGRQQGDASMMLGVAEYQRQNFSAARRAFSAAAESRKTRETAKQWIAYLDSGLARENALRMAAVRPNDSAQLSGRFSGDKVGVGSASAVGPRASAGFTPIGAQREASRDGRIPAWTGGLKEAEWPAGFSKGQRLQDPYPNDQALYVIDATNWQQYQDDLSLGHRALLGSQAGYRMPVYQSRRGVAYPQAIYDATQANRGRAKLLGSDALTGARLGFPFSSPRNGVEVMWNHRVRYRGNATESKTRQALILANGKHSEEFLQTERVLYRYGNIDDPSDLARENILLYYLTHFSAGGTNFTALVHESANSIERDRSIWVIPQGISKMFRIPPVGYDNPFPGSGGIAFVDMVDMYNGAFDRYDWKILGKKEVLLPYNAYRLNDASQSNADLLQKGFMNPSSARYEMHRVWLIEANERGGKRHSFGARRFYVDEDSWNVVLVENYDRKGNLWRFQEGHLTPLYDRLWTNTMPVVTYDLKDGRYFINRLSNDDPWPEIDPPRMEQKDFNPSTVKARYAR
ncbi:MAG: DUF1329 domain-containing protein [Oceanococcus sp.]